MVAVAAEDPIRGADAVAQQAVATAAGDAVKAADAGDAPAGKEEVREYASDMRKLEDLLSKLNPSAEEFVPLSRRRPGDASRQLSADAPVFISPAIDYYTRHPQPQPMQMVQLVGSPRHPQPQPMQVVQLVGSPGAGAGGVDSGSDGSASGQPNRRRRNGPFNHGRRRVMGGRPGRADREDSVRRTVYVSDIDQHVTEQKLAELFATCGQVVDCRICGDPNSVLRFAFIEFADDVGARTALTLNGTVLGFYPVKVLPSKTAILPVNPRFLPRTEDEREMVSRTIYCTNIDKKVSEDEVKKFFEGSCGEVARLRLLGDYVHSTCIAFVEFVQAESGILALNCSGVVLGSLQVRQGHALFICSNLLCLSILFLSCLLYLVSQSEPFEDTSAPAFAPYDVNCSSKAVVQGIELSASKSSSHRESTLRISNCH